MVVTKGKSKCVLVHGSVIGLHIQLPVVTTGQSWHSLNRVEVPSNLPVVIHTCKWRHCVAGFPHPKYISWCLERVKRIYIQSQGFAFFFLPLPAPLLPSFFLKFLFLIYFLQTKKFKIPVARPTTRKPSGGLHPQSVLGRVEGHPPRAAWSPWSRSSDEPPSVIIQATGSKDIEDNESSSTKPEEEPLHISKSCLRSGQSVLTLPWSPGIKSPSCFTFTPTQLKPTQVL